MALLVKNTLKYEPLPFIEKHESVWCKIFVGDTVLVIGVVYRPPGSPIEFLNQLDDHLTELTNEKSRIILTGDFNISDVNWDARIAGPTERSHADTMLEIMAKHSLIQVVNGPTRIQGQCQTTLDLLFLSDETFKYEVSIKDGISDHKVVVAGVRVKHKPSKVKASTVNIYDFEHADDASILDYLELALDRMPQEDDMNLLWAYFKSVVEHCLSRFVPLKRKRIQRANPWITRNIIHLKRRLKRARQKKIQKQYIDNSA